MKKLFTLILIIIGILGLVYIIKDGSIPNIKEEDVTGETLGFRPNPRNASFTFDDTRIVLSDGKSENPSGNYLVTETRLLEEVAYGDLNADSKTDTAVFLVRSGGASGVFLYTAVYISGPIGYKGSNALFLGDRISPQSISISNGIVTVNYLDRSSNEPFAAEPTISETKQFVYKNGKLEER